MAITTRMMPTAAQRASLVGRERDQVQWAGQEVVEQIQQQIEREDAPDNGGYPEEDVAEANHGGHVTFSMCGCERSGLRRAFLTHRLRTEPATKARKS